MRLRSSHDPETVNELISLVNDKVEQALRGNPQCSFQKALMLSALHMAEELLLLKRVAREELNQLEGKAKQILTHLESSPALRLRIDS